MMPGMDGIETTRLIRIHDTHYAQSVPIIALTANAVAGNEQMFLEEGFQAFVSKPIKISKLDAAIHEWIVNKRVGAPTVDDVPDVPTVADDSPADVPTVPDDAPAGINMKLGLSLYEDDMDMLLEIMRSYAKNVPTELARMKSLSEDGLGEYAIDIHTLKGASSSIGAKELTVRAKKLERMAKSGDYAGVAELNDEFIADAERLIADLTQWLANR
jgi:CheY-like chemotaxis protein